MTPNKIFNMKMKIYKLLHSYLLVVSPVKERNPC